MYTLSEDDAEHDGEAGDSQDVVHAAGGHHEGRDVVVRADTALLQVQHSWHHHSGGHCRQHKPAGEDNDTHHEGICGTCKN